MREPDFQIREELPGDGDAVRAVNEAAFEHPDEADLAERLHEEGVVLLSLVAETDDLVVGHILFSRMTVEVAQGNLPAAAPAPMTVLPGYQRRGIGFYPRFGFCAAKARHLSHSFPADAFMGLELVDGALTDVRGTVRYPGAFGL